MDAENPGKGLERNDRDLLPMAIEMAVKAHRGVLNRDGTPYILHPLRLMMRAKGYADQIVAVLHDTIEDTPLTLQDLTEAGFPAEIVLAVDALTKREGEGYEGFIERIALNSLAVRVKLLDLYDNIDVTRLPELSERDLQRTLKYHHAILRLKRTTSSVMRQNIPFEETGSPLYGKADADIVAPRRGCPQAMENEHSFPA